MAHSQPESVLQLISWHGQITVHHDSPFWLERAAQMLQSVAGFFLTEPVEHGESQDEVE